MIIEDGEEKLRFPPIDKNNKVAKVAKYNYRILLRYFDLESRYLETRSWFVRCYSEMIANKLY